MPSAIESITATSDAPATCTTHSSGQYVRSRMNSVSTVTNVSACIRRQKAASSSEVVINCGGGNAGRGARFIRFFYTVGAKGQNPWLGLRDSRWDGIVAGCLHHN